MTDSDDAPRVRDFAELRDSGLLWLINAAALHPRGVALALVMDDDGDLPRARRGRGEAADHRGAVRARTRSGPVSAPTSRVSTTSPCWPRSPRCIGVALAGRPPNPGLVVRR